MATIAVRRLRNAIKQKRALKRGGGRDGITALPGDLERSAQMLLDLMVSSAKTPSRSAASHEAVEAMRAAVAELPADYRRAVQLVYIEGKSVAAAIHFTIGHTYDTLWRQAAAADELRKARDLYEQAYGPEHPETLKCMVLLGMVLGELRLPEAVEVQRQALETRRKIYGDEHALVAESLAEYAYTLWIAAVPRRWGEAERYYQEALDMYRRTLGPEHRDVARQMFACGAMYLTQGRMREAEGMLRESLEISQRLLSGEHQFVAECRLAYVDILEHKGRYEEAEGLLRELIAIWPGRFGTVWRPVMLRRMGSLQLAKGDIVEAHKWYDRSVVEACGHLAEAHPRHAERLRSLAEGFQRDADRRQSRDYRAPLIAIGELTNQPIQTVDALRGFAGL
ncbi:MAG: tetratricopeptide repeat protein [Phycisphaerae bacterium]|jgi:tetratricopeptide (TPR) repeat protein